MIEILLSTFNSIKHLREQVESLNSQTYTNWKLLIRDDGSTDGTLDELKKIQIEFSDKIKLFIDNQNVGVIKSFEYLLSKSTAEYIMFCDHDDIWLNDKIEKTYDKIKKMEVLFPSKPLLVFTDLTVVDEDIKIIHNSFWKFSKLNPKYLSNFNYLGICNGITGCTVMLNKKAKEISIPFSKNARMHDWWIALKVSKIGKIGYLNESTILYRQHENNHIGASEVKNTITYINSKLMSIKKVFYDNKLQINLLKELNYGNILKYFYFKLLYFLKARF